MLLLIALLLLPAPVRAQLPAGIVTGVVRDDTGKPRPDVRVAAVAPPEQTAGADVLVAISRTDQDGRYRLEVPPGRFFIAAGRVDKPTYYPDATEVATATTIQVHSGATSNDVDMIASAESLTPSRQIARTIPLAQPSIGRLSSPSIALPPTNLLPFLTGYSASQNTKLIFEFVGLTGRTASFKTVSGSFSYSCLDCSFFVRDRGVGPQTIDPGMLFKASSNGQSLDFTCAASTCNMAQVTPGGISVSQLSRNQTGTVQATDQVAFAIIP